MEFSTKAEKLQPGQDGALLYICEDACPCSKNSDNETAALLCGSLEEKQSFAETRVIENGKLKAVAVVRLKDLNRETLAKAAAETTPWAQK